MKKVSQIAEILIEDPINTEKKIANSCFSECKKMKKVSQIAEILTEDPINTEKKTPNSCFSECNKK